MKALTIKEPWASLILSGRKKIETRTWHTKYRGLVLLHASKSPKSAISGKAFAIAWIKDCVKMVPHHVSLAQCDFYDAYSWFLADVTPITPFEMKGQLGLFHLDEKVEEILFSMYKNSQSGVRVCSCGKLGYRASYADRCNECLMIQLRAELK